MFEKIRGAVAGFWHGLTGPSRSGVARQLRADATPHEAGQATNLIASLSTLAVNALHALTVRTRRIRTRLRRRVLHTSGALTDALLALTRFRTDPAVVANATQAEVARAYEASGKAHFLDVRVWRGLVVLIAAIVAIADFGFMFAVYRDLFVLSVASFQIGQLGEWAVAITLPLLFPAVVIALAEFGGRSVGRRLARRKHPERAEQILGSRIAEYERSWGAAWVVLAYAATALLIGLFFFVMAIHRFGTAASDAGLDFPSWALAVGYGVLPIVALLVDIASRDVVLEHDRRTLKTFARNERTRAGLERNVLDSRATLTTAWLSLKWVLTRVVQDANQSLVMFEQLVADGYARSGAIGALAPLAGGAEIAQSAESAQSGADARVQADARAQATGDYALPSLTQRRSLTTPIMRWLTVELEADLEVLRRHAPDAAAGEEAVSRVLNAAGTPGAATAPAHPATAESEHPDPVHPEPETAPHEMIEFPDRRTGEPDARTADENAMEEAAG